MAAILPFPARIPALIRVFVAVAGSCLVLIGVLSLAAVFSTKPARRRAAAEGVRVLWITRNKEE